MYPSVTLCRSQQDNVRMVADKAAIAWGVEAEEAEHREARRARTRFTANLQSSEKRENAKELQAWPSENPDRNVADIPTAR